MSQRVKHIEKKPLSCGETKNENTFVPASPVPIPASPVSVKLYTYDGKTEWELYKIQFGIISEVNRCTEGIKACQLVASLRGEAAEVLQTLTDTEMLNLNSLYNALDLARLQMETRYQKPEESLQEYAFGIQKLTTLGLSDLSANVREMISLEYFVDGLMVEEIQMAVRMTDVKDPHSALLYTLKVEAATRASCIDRHSIREARVALDAPCESP
ncbi:uncharacterized protein TNCV_2421091 [Trichonephila clavipes]|uniref:Uncharacterized protein n=1 Tax=Trichonephila clavipes TaxID=2585209 RepID=A0A8X6R8K2_TRICX|nr:uncharacterized protein TNCV_2421091 [Trichonephila clavipes]